MTHVQLTLVRLLRSCLMLSFCSCCCCCCLCSAVCPQKDLEKEIADEKWIEEDKGYSSETMRNQIMSRYPQSMPPLIAAAAAASGVGSVGRDPRAMSADGQHVGRQLQLIHGELASIASSLRIIADRVITKGRASVVRSLEKLGNSPPDPDESGTYPKWRTQQHAELDVGSSIPTSGRC